MQGFPQGASQTQTVGRTIDKVLVMEAFTVDHESRNLNELTGEQKRELFNGGNPPTSSN